MLTSICAQAVGMDFVEALPSNSPLACMAHACNPWYPLKADLHLTCVVLCCAMSCSS